MQPMLALFLNFYPPRLEKEKCGSPTSFSRRKMENGARAVTWVRRELLLHFLLPAAPLRRPRCFENWSNTGPEAKRQTDCLEGNEGLLGHVSLVLHRSQLALCCVFGVSFFLEFQPFRPRTSCCPFWKRYCLYGAHSCRIIAIIFPGRYCLIMVDHRSDIQRPIKPRFLFF